LRGKLSGLMICALVLVVVGGRGYAADMTVKASSPIKGEGRFYKATDQLLLFSGYFQGNVEVESQRGEWGWAGVSGDDGSQPHRLHATAGRPVYHRDAGRRFPLCRLDLYRETG
jgi:hypothetical protein